MNQNVDTMYAVGTATRLFLIISTSVLGMASAQRGTEPVPAHFSYPKSPQIQVFAHPQKVRSLKGKVLGPSGTAVAGPVLVEIVKALGSDDRLDAAFASQEGNFDLGKRKNGRYYLKISMDGFDSRYITVVLATSGDAEIRVALRPST